MNFEDSPTPTTNKIFSHWGNLMALAIILISLIILAFQITSQYRHKNSVQSDAEIDNSESFIQTGNQSIDKNSGLLTFTHSQYPKLKISHDKTWKLMSKGNISHLGDLNVENLEISLTKKTTVITVSVTPQENPVFITECFSESEKPYTAISATTMRINKKNGGTYWKRVATLEKSTDPSRFQITQASLEKDSSACLSDNSCSICYSSANQETTATSTLYKLPDSMLDPENPTTTYPSLVTAEVVQSVVDPEILKEADKIVDDFVKVLQ